MMTPQLFINYKLKSVAHLPWRAFMYKAFNTFIDDAFAVIIDMPTKHRVMTLRDDLGKSKWTGLSGLDSPPQSRVPVVSCCRSTEEVFADRSLAWCVMTLLIDMCLGTLVFFIYLYQRYLYPVDKTRANEFGRCDH